VLPEVPAGAPAAAGPVTIGEGTPDARLAVVNIDTGESNPAATTEDQFTAAVTRTTRSGSPAPEDAARDMEDRQRWWQVGLLIMLVALAGEGLVGRRAT
jgi:hypothetical protein